MESARSTHIVANEIVLAVALELAQNSWKVALQDGQHDRPSIHSVSHVQACGRLEQVVELIRRMLEKWHLPADTRVVVNYEAGQDGFWLVRALARYGYEVLPIDAASIEVNRHQRRAKTDRIDAARLVNSLRGWLQGDRDRMRVLHVPSAEAEDQRQWMRDRGQIQKEINQHLDRMRKLLRTQGCWVDHKMDIAELVKSGELTDHSGAPLPESLNLRLLRECERLAQAEQQLAKLEAGMLAALPKATQDKVKALCMLKAIGPVGAQRLVTELYWRDFHNRREVGACVGLVPQPYDSGQSHVDQGISKQGNRRVRALLIEMAWFWLRYQPTSELAQWFIKRTSGTGENKRHRKITIVGVARKLAIALWRYLDTGEIPAGAQLKMS